MAVGCQASGSVIQFDLSYEISFSFDDALDPNKSHYASRTLENGWYDKRVPLLVTSIRGETNWDCKTDKTYFEQLFRDSILQGYELLQQHISELVHTHHMSGALGFIPFNPPILIFLKLHRMYLPTLTVS